MLLGSDGAPTGLRKSCTRLQERGSERGSPIQMGLRWGSGGAPAGLRHEEPRFDAALAGLRRGSGGAPAGLRDQINRQTNNNKYVQRFTRRLPPKRLQP